MTTTGSNLTSSEELGSSEGGVTRCIVPAPGTSSSNNGHGKNATSGVGHADGGEKRQASPLRMKGGGTELDSDKGREEEPGSSSPVMAVPGPSKPRKGGPASKTGRGKEYGRKDEDKEGEVGKTEGDKERGRKRTKEGGPELERDRSRSEVRPRGSRDGSAASAGGSSTGSKRMREEEVEVDRDAGMLPASSPVPGSASPERRTVSLDRGRGRGRPAKYPGHEGQYTYAKCEERKQRMEAKKKEEESVREMQRFEDAAAANTPAVTNTKRAKQVDKHVFGLMEGLKGAPTASVTKLGFDAVEKIKRVATTSTNLKGEYTGHLWLAVEEITACNLTLTGRVNEIRGEDEEERVASLEGMRMEIASLRAREAELKEQVRAMRDQLAQTHATGPPKPGKAKGTSRKRSKKHSSGSTSSSPEEDVIMGLERMERELSPSAIKVGRRARAEVEQDLREGTMPPAVRPSLGGRSKELEWGGVPPARCAEVQPPPPKGKQGGLEGGGVPPALGAEVQPPPPKGKQRGLGGGGIPPARGAEVRPPPPVAAPVTGSLEDVLRVVLGSLAAAGMIAPFAGTPALGGLARGGVGPLTPGAREKEAPPSTRAVAELMTAGGQGDGRGKKRKKKKKKRKGGQGGKTGAEDSPSQPGPSSSQTGKSIPPSNRVGEAAHGQPASPPGDTWAQVVRRGGGKRQEGKQQGGGQVPPPKKPPQPGVGTRVTLPRGPRGAAVVITCPEGRYAEVMTEARGKIKLEDIGISGIRTRRAVTGALVLEIPGQEGTAKAENLKKRLEDLFAGREGVKVTRPVRRSELRVRDLDDSVTAQDVVRAVAETGGCGEGEVQVGPIKKGPNNLGTAWVRCPLAAARKAVAGGRLTVGWTAARVEALAIRPLQCFKCLKEGHVRAQCPNEVDRSGLCYRCGSTDHKAGRCTEAAKCTVCADAGLPSAHRLGGRACKGVRAGPKKRGAGPSQQVPRKDPGMGTREAGAERKDPSPPLEQRVREGRTVKGAEGSAPMDWVGLEEAGAVV